MSTLVATMVGFVIVAVLVAIIAHRLHLPYTVGLVFAGIALTFGPVSVHTALTSTIIYDLILPPLLFEAAINLRWKVLRKDALPLLTLALPGTMIAALLVATGAVWLLHWPMKPALLFGVLIAATDPVSIISMLKDNGVKGRLRLLVEGESLLNDAVAAVLFSLTLGWVESSGATPITSGQISHSLALIVGGGIFFGVMCAVGAIILAGKTADYLVESALTLVVAYGSFVLAERLGFSGVVATVSAGLVMGNLGILADEKASRISRRGREFTLALWSFIAFIANSLVFLLIGLTVVGIPFAILGFGTLAVIVLVVLVSRALSVYPLCALFRRSTMRLEMWHQHVLWWGGLRGALGLALALSLAPSVPMRDQIVVATFGVVIWSIVIQGLTMPLFLRAFFSREREELAQ